MIPLSSLLKIRPLQIIQSEMRKLLECCNCPLPVINTLTPYTFEQAKQALLKNDNELLTKILSSNSHFPNQEDSLLLAGISQGKEETVLFLLRQFGSSCEFSRRNDKGDTPLMMAIFRKMHRVLKILIERCDINGCDFRRNSPFIAAAANGDIQAMKMLIQTGQCNTMMKNTDGQTALHRACYFGEIEVVDWLLDNTNLKVGERDRKGSNCLHLACEGVNIALTRYIMEKVKRSDRLLEENSEGQLPKKVLHRVIQGFSSLKKDSFEFEHLQ